MSWWRRLLGAHRASQTSVATPVAVDSTSANESVAAAEEADADLAVLIQPGVLAPRMAALRRLGGTVREPTALSAVARARENGHAPDELVVAAADLHVQRGELEAATELLRGVASPAGVLLAADVHAERGALPRALMLVERVLARDIDSPGARERHERWRLRLGVSRPRATVAAAESTVLRADVSRGELRIVGEAGRGGAGTVYEAVDEALGRRVALKIYHRPAEERTKLVREARTAVTLASTGVVRVFDADPAQGFIVMEWLGRGALTAWISRSREGLLAAFPRWYPKLVASVAGVHRRGWVHADIKPANVLFRDEVTPVLSDFGLAQRPGQVEAGGSLGYLSPERIAGQPLGFADDVFALGRILEDVLDALEGRDDVPPLRPWRRLAERATGDPVDRPTDASRLLLEVSREIDGAAIRPG